MQPTQGGLVLDGGSVGAPCLASLASALILRVLAGAAMPGSSGHNFVVKGYHNLLLACEFMGEVCCDRSAGSR